MKSLVQFYVVSLAGKHPGGVISIDPDKVVAVQSDEHSTAARIYLEGGSSWLVRDTYETVVAEIWETGAQQVRRAAYNVSATRDATIASGALASTDAASDCAFAPAEPA